MPSSQSVSRTVTGLTRNRPRLAIGAGGAALVSLIGVAAATTGPAISLTAAHGPAEASAGAISPALHVPASTAPRAGGSAAAASPQVASAPVQHAQPAGSARAASPQVTSAANQQPRSGGSAAAASPQLAAAPAEQQAQSSGSVPAASPQVAAAPAEQQAAAASASPSAGSAAVGRHAADAHRADGTASQPAAASTQPAATPSQSAAPSQPAATPAPQPAPQPYQIYDSVTPSAIPASSQAIAVYADGNYAASQSQVGHRGLVLWIDTNGSDPNADVLDVEPGDATPTQAATWVAQKLDASPNSVAIIYTMKSEWSAVQAAVNALPWWMPSHTRYWIADPTGVPHIVPGSQATQWYWGQNYDISTALPGF
jgi:hypothetical protein